MSTRGNENASTPPEREEGFEMEELDLDMIDMEKELSEIDMDFASLEAELAEIDMEEELAELDNVLDSEEVLMAFAAMEEEMETACKELEDDLQRLDFPDFVE